MAALKRGPEEEGYAVDVARIGEDGLWMGVENLNDVIILDVRLPDPGLRFLAVQGAGRSGQHSGAARARNGLPYASIVAIPGPTSPNQEEAFGCGHRHHLY